MGDVKRIVSGVLEGGRAYGPGDEDALAAALPPAALPRLLALGVLAGDWAPAPEPAPAAAPPEPPPPEPPPEPPKRGRRKAARPAE